MEETVIIRRARPSDAQHLPAVERSAGEAFRALPDLAWVADHDVESEESYSGPIAAGTVWIAEREGRIAGVLLSEVHGEALHILEIAVAREFQQRGIGHRLIDAAAAYARVKGLAALTLTTFRHVAWNAPFYARYGFVELVNPGEPLKAILKSETARGLPNRCAMRLALDPLAFDVRDVVRRKVLLEDQASWLAAIGDLAVELAGDWQLTLGDYLAGGTEAVVLEADTADGERCVLKLCIPGMDPTQSEMRVLAAAKGGGYVRLVRHDAARNAMLLERLGDKLHDLGLSSDAKLAAICATLPKAWIPLPQGEHFTTGAEKAQGLADMIKRLWRTLDKPCEDRTIDMALSFASERARAFDARHAVLAHGDAHEWNTLTVPGASPGGYKFVDPDGLFIERAYDLGISMRENADELLAGDPVQLGRRRCRLLSELTGVEEVPIWQWGFIERVATGLLCRQLEKDGADDVLAVADAWSAA